MKRILVTGADGFTGKHLVARLRAEGHEVTGFDIAQGDIAGFDPFEKYTYQSIDYVFHLAGKTFVPESWQRPYEFYRVNNLGTLNALEFCRHSGSNLTYISSYLYGSPEYLPVDEKHPVKAYNPYAHSKVLAESLCRQYKTLFGLESIIIRPFNIYGPGQSGLFLIPEVIQKVLKPSIPVVEIMDGKPKRDFLFVDDYIDALVLSMEWPRETVNLGSGSSASVKEIVEEVMQISGIHKPVKDSGSARPNEIPDLYADISFARKLGWNPVSSLHEGLEKCIDSIKLTI
ncbi:MAG: NAD-dependent epimerase/dehydratase family protein [Bacteroidota bacterium]|nr:NAD-dependent epimerase/dehydratase family protein [Bacteroidota bacterium]